MQEQAEIPEVAIAAATMHGDLMALVVDELKAAPDIWHRMGAGEQDEVIERVKKRTGAAIEECVRMIATQGFTRIKAKLDSIAVKDGIKAVITLSQHDAARHELVDAQGSIVYIVIADTAQFCGGADGVTSEPDQGALTLGAIEQIGRATKKHKPAADGATEGDAT